MKLILTLITVYTSILYSQTIENIPDEAKDIKPLLIGAQVPDIELTQTDGKTVKLSDITAQTPAIIIFYRGGWCPFCNIQLGQIQKILPEIIKLGYSIIAISPDRPEELKKSTDKNSLEYTLLSDSTMEASIMFGIAFKVADSVIERYKMSNMDLEKSSGENHHLLPVPSVFITGTDGSIKFQYVNPNYKVRIDPELLLAAAKSAL